MFHKHSKSSVSYEPNDILEAVEVESFNINTKTPKIVKKPNKSPKPVKHTNDIITSIENISRKLPYIDVNHLECSCDNVPLLPIELGCYAYIDIDDEDMKIFQQTGHISYRPGKEGTVEGCIVVKTKNSFAIPIFPKEGLPVLQRTMNRIDLIKKVKGIDGLVYVDIKVTDDLGEKVIRVPRKVFEEKEIVSSLAKYNISVYSVHAMPMAIYFKRLLEKMPMEDASMVVGVVKNIDTSEVEFNGYGVNGFFKTKSKFKTYKEYLKHFNPLLEQSTPLQYLLAATMATPVLTILQQKYNYDLHSYCINMIGASSTGKTICSRVCASAWTNPTDEIIFSSMNSTHNRAISRLSGRYGVPIFYDEATNGGDIKPDKYAYSIYNGCDKGRLNRDGSEKASGTWSTIVCMSSEQHFHNNAKNQNGGLANRVHSMDDLPWTASKKHAEALNRFIKDNYGVLGKIFTKSLFKEDRLNQLETFYAEAKEIMDAYCSKNQGCFTDRLCQTYALTYMTAVMLKGIGLAIDVTAVAEIMARHNAMVSEEQNLAKNAFNAVVSYVANTDHVLDSGIRRYSGDHGKLLKVAVEDSVMNKILAKAGFKDTKVTMKELANAGYLIRQDKRGLKSKITIGGTLCWCYQIDMKSLLDDTEAEYNSEEMVEFIKGRKSTLLMKQDEICEDIDDTDEAETKVDEIDYNINNDEAESEKDEADSELMLCFDKSAEEDEYDVTVDKEESEEEETDSDPAFYSDESEEDEEDYDIDDDEAESEEDEADSELLFRFNESTEEDEYDVNVDEEESEDDEPYSQYVENSGIDWDEIPMHSSRGCVEDEYESEDDDEDEYDYYG